MKNYNSGDKCILNIVIYYFLFSKWNFFILFNGIRVCYGVCVVACRRGDNKIKFRRQNTIYKIKYLYHTCALHFLSYFFPNLLQIDFVIIIVVFLVPNDGPRMNQTDKFLYIHSRHNEGRLNRPTDVRITSVG